MGTFYIWKKRWILTSSLVFLALISASATTLKLPRSYEASSTVVLLASRGSSKATAGGNPYLNFSDTLSTTATVISSELTDLRTVTALKTQGFPESYQVVSQSTLSNSSLLPAPFLIVTVTGSRKVSVERTLDGVTNEIGIALNELQAWHFGE